MGSKRALEGGWDKALKKWCFYCAYSNNMSNTRTSFRNSEVILHLFIMHTGAKLIENEKILLQVLRKKTFFNTLFTFLASFGGG